MKKIVALLVALLMLMSLVACGDSSGKQEEPAKDSSEKADETKKDDEKVTAYFVGIMRWRCPGSCSKGVLKMPARNSAGMAIT